MRFTSRKAIRESLAGRMAFFEMLPFTVSEIREEQLPNTLLKLLSHRIFSVDSIAALRSKKELVGVKKDFETYLKNGGLPGLCFIREKKLQIDSMRFLHDLIIDRDLRMVLATKLPMSTIRKFLEWIAGNSWNRYSSAEVKRQLKLAPQTQKNLLYAMESVFLIRRIPITGQKGEVILLEDQLEEFILSKDAISDEKQNVGAFFRNIRAQFSYRLGNEVRYESYRTRDGAVVPLVINSPDSILGFILIEEDLPNLSEKRSAASFLGRFVTSKVIFISKELKEPVVLDERSLLAPLYSLI